MANIPWSGTTDNKLYLQSDFTSTLKTSQDVSSLDSPFDIGVDENLNTLWLGSGGASGAKLFTTSGQFTSTIKTSQDVSAVDTAPQGGGDIAAGESNFVWSGITDDKVYDTSGRYSSTLKTSQDVSAINTTMSGASAQSTSPDTLMAGIAGAADKLYTLSGRFSSTLKNSAAFPTTSPRSNSFDDTNTIAVSSTSNKLYYLSGQYTSTVKSSVSLGGVDSLVHGSAREYIAPVTDSLTPRQLRRHARSKRPPLFPLQGRHRRWGSIPNTDKATPPAGKLPAHFWRILHSKHPAPSEIKGRMRRAGGKPDFVAPPFKLVRRHRKLFRDPPSHNLLRGRFIRRTGKSQDFTEYAQTFEQSFRVADDSLDLYQLFVGEDASPNFGAAPAQTSATLPFNYTPTPPGTGATKDLHLVVRKQNAYGLQSFNVYEKIITIDSGSSEVITISPPLDVVIYDAAAGAIRVVAKYVSLDDPSPADTWEVFVTIGSDPNPLVDTPAFTGSMSFVGVEAMLSEVITGYTPGDVAHVIVVAKRAAGSEVGIAAVVLFTLALSLDLDDGQMFGGSVYEQR